MLVRVLVRVLVPISIKKINFFILKPHKHPSKHPSKHPPQSAGFSYAKCRVGRVLVGFHMQNACLGGCLFTVLMPNTYLGSPDTFCLETPPLSSLMRQRAAQFLGKLLPGNPFAPPYHRFPGRVQVFIIFLACSQCWGLACQSLLGSRVSRR